MDLLSPLPLAFALVLASLWLFNQWRSRTHSHQTKLRSPPEPPGAWPIIGHLRLLRGTGQTPLARTLGAMADKYGPIFLFRLGVHPVVVVSNWESFKECFTANDIALASRPQSGASKYLGYNMAGFGFAPYGPFWRDMRKLVAIELLSAHRLELFKRVRISEIHSSIKQLYRTSKNEEAFAMNPWLEQLTLNIITRMVSGKRYFDRTGEQQDPGAGNFRRVVKEFMYLSGVFVLSDVIPFPPLMWVDLILGGKLRKVKRVMRELDGIVESWIEEHVGERKGGGKEEEEDFIDVMLGRIDEGGSFGHTRETIIKATVLNLILAGSDTTSINLTWLLSILLNNPPALTRAREEIDAQVGKTRWVEESDIKGLFYLQAIVKETLRLYPPGPLAVPHQATEDCEIAGYSIPKGTRLFPNVWKLHRDPRVWPDPEKFVPERWLPGNHAAGMDVSGKNFEFCPFGSGRRSCPGTAFAMQVTQLTLARLVQGFEIATPGKEPVDMDEGLGITLPKVRPLEVVITPRLASDLYEG